MSGGGWTKIPYANDLVDKHYFNNAGDAWRWVQTDFSLALTNTQINAIRAVSSEGRQRYVGLCDGVITYNFGTSNYSDAFGFRFHTGDETVFGQQNYTGTNITVVEDGCKINRTYSLNTVFEINDMRVPIVNVKSKDSGNSSETFGSPLTNNPAWFR
ncbi:MAG: hypothetical protein L3J43_05700 [Sulfurovum sp.]|nr:hypothetical protein [Sulfurovum sp.]